MEQLKTKTTQELKALAYDIGSALNQYQQTLQMINNEILERMRQEQAQQPVEPTVSKKQPKTKSAD